MTASRSLGWGEVVALVHADLSAGPDAGVVQRVSSLEQGSRGSVVFATDEVSLTKALASNSSCVLATRELRTGEAVRDPRVLWVQDARLAFALVAHALRGQASERVIAPTAEIDESASIGQGTRIGPGVIVEAGVVIGENCTIQARAVLQSGTELGNRVIVQAGAVLGSTGFGYVRVPDTGEYVLFPQQGTLVIEDDVEIGANATIDRGALGETRIGAGTKIDNLVHIAHNCSIGRNVVIAAQTGIAGSSEVGDGAIIAGQVGIADHVVIGAGVVLGAKAGVPSGKRLQGAGQVFWGIPARPLQQYLRELAQLRRTL